MLIILYNKLNLFKLKILIKNFKCYYMLLYVPCFLIKFKDVKLTYIQNLSLNNHKKNINVLQFLYKCYA